ncbi:MAG: AraC family transcriptional regulator [Myxococcota bacterium]
MNRSCIEAATLEDARRRFARRPLPERLRIHQPEKSHVHHRFEILEIADGRLEIDCAQGRLRFEEPGAVIVRPGTPHAIVASEGRILRSFSEDYATPSPFSEILRAVIHPAVRRAMAFIVSNLHRKVVLDELSAKVGLSKFHLCRRFTSELGRSPSNFHRDMRLDTSYRLIQEGRGLSQPTTILLFCDQSHFIRSFRRNFGRTPGRLRAAHPEWSAARWQPEGPLRQVV